MPLPLGEALQDSSRTVRSSLESNRVRSSDSFSRLTRLNGFSFTYCHSDAATPKAALKAAMYRLIVEPLLVLPFVIPLVPTSVLSFVRHSTSFAGVTLLRVKDPNSFFQHLSWVDLANLSGLESLVISSAR